MGAMGGRQYFVDAPLSMTSARELTNIRYSWDGFRGYAFWKNFRVDIFDFWQTDFSKDHVFGAGPSYNARMFGGLASYALPSFKVQNVNSQLYLDAFYIGYLYNGNAAGLPTPTPGKNRQGSTRRDNIGGRLNGNIGNFTIDITGICHWACKAPIFLVVTITKITARSEILLFPILQQQTIRI